MTVRELLAQIDSRELSEWWAFYQLEPWGCETEDLRSGVVAATVANANRDPKKRYRAYQPTDFMPSRGAPAAREEQSWEEQARILEAWGRAWETKFGEGSS